MKKSFSHYRQFDSMLFLKLETAKEILWNPGLNRHQDYDFVVRYSKRYKWIPKITPTVIYMLISASSKIDFSSCIRFIRENKESISPNHYCKYHLNMLALAKRRNESPKIIKHYQTEATRYKEYLSYVQFLQIRNPQSKMEILQLKLEYLWYILRIGVE